jgi:pyrrolidone-carboxylate peptidase
VGVQRSDRQEGMPNWGRQLGILCMAAIFAIYVVRRRRTRKEEARGGFIHIPCHRYYRGTQGACC